MNGIRAQAPGVPLQLVTNGNRFRWECPCGVAHVDVTSEDDALLEAAGLPDTFVPKRAIGHDRWGMLGATAAQEEDVDVYEFVSHANGQPDMQSSEPAQAVGLGIAFLQVAPSVGH